MTSGAHVPRACVLSVREADENQRSGSAFRVWPSAATRIKSCGGIQIESKRVTELVTPCLNGVYPLCIFRDQKTLDQFNWSFNPSIPRKQLYDLASCRYLRERRDVLFLGPPGVGKSFLVQALGYEAIKQGYVVLYRSIFDVVRDFLQDEAFSGQERVLSRYLKPDLLIVDDMGMKHLPKQSGEYLFEIIMRRYETRSTIMTSNRPLQDWGKLIGDVPSATAILDRFLHHAEMISITGRSYRLQHPGLAPDQTDDSETKPPPTVPPVTPPSEGDEDSKPANAPTGSKHRKDKKKTDNP